MPSDSVAIDDFPQPETRADRASKAPVLKDAGSTESFDEKRARLLDEKRARDAEQLALAKQREVEALELEAKYSDELGPKGQSFDILPTRMGPVALKLPAEVQFKDIRAALTGATLPTQETLAGFVMPNVLYPSRAKFLEMVGKHPGIYVGAGTVLASLCNGEELETKGK